MPARPTFVTTLARMSDVTRVVKLRFFAGFSVPEVAAVLGISVAKAERHWAFSRHWLFAELNESGEPSPDS